MIDDNESPDDRLSDPTDIASKEEELARRAHLFESQRSREKPPARFDGVHCIEEDCEIEIPQLRLDHGCFRCFDCQTFIEQRKKKQGL